MKLRLLLAPVAVAVTGLAAFVMFRAGLHRVVSSGIPVPALGPRVSVPLDFEMVIFDGNLGPGWEDRGWGPHELSAGGPARVQFQGFGGIALHHAELPPRFSALAFRFNAPPEFSQFLEVSLKSVRIDDKALPTVPVEARHVADVGGGWKEALIPFGELDPSSVPFDRIVLRANRPLETQWVLLDKIGLTKWTGGDASAAPSVRSVHLSIDCEKPALAINPLIYGIAQGEWETGETGHRVGGNPMSRLNWDLGFWNAGSDWYFENVKSSTGLWDWIEETYAHHVSMAVVVPMLGWVAKDATSVSFPVSKFGPQKAHDPERPDVGDGQTPAGKAIAPGPPMTTSIPAPPELIRRWIETVRRKDAERGARGVQMYILDNEPNLWNKTHRDVHPDPLTYDELLDRTIRYATAIREADPDAIIAGPAEWGWSGYFFSAKDSLVGWNLAPDRLLHGGTPLLPWYLQRLSQHEKRTGKRLLDVVDVHFYPQAEGVYGNARTDPDSAALRLRSTRALWDPDYKDESWIDAHVNLIPRVKDWIERNYPGRGVSLGEWSFGAEKDISGALAIAEALGRFGQQGLYSAFYWAKILPNTPAFHAFRAFRNFDGQGGRFLDWSIPTQESDKVSLFASRDEASSHLVAIVLNLDPTFAVQTEIDTHSCGRVTTRRVFTYGRDSSSFAERRAAAEGSPEVLAPYSLTVLDMTTAKDSGP